MLSVAELVTKTAKLLLFARVGFVFISNKVYSSEDLFVTEPKINSIKLPAAMKLLFTKAIQRVRRQSRDQIKQRVPRVLKCLIDFQWCFVVRGRTT